MAALWVENPGHVYADYVARAPREQLYRIPIAVRSGQQDILFETDGQAFIRMDVCVLTATITCDSGSQGVEWSVLYDGAQTLQQVRWTRSTVPATVGSYEIKMRYYRLSGPIESFLFDMFVVPPAQRAFINGAGDSIILWQGSTSALDSPLLVVEGIDADNVNTPNHYYAIAGLQSTLLTLGRQRGADVLILDFADGGTDIGDNAWVVEMAILYLNGIKTGSRRLDLAGLSMGGVVTRYALASMEERSVTHNVGRWVSIDAPQQGAWIDGQLLDWMHNPPFWAAGKFTVPRAISGMAGMQLLGYNPFDTAFPTRHTQFYSELNQLNSGLYPRFTTENIGVSFGTPSPQSHVGAPQWLRIHVTGVVPDQRFYLEQGSPEIGAGSLLPRDVTSIGGISPFLTFDLEFNLVRAESVHPTFIPYASALDIVNGASRFGGVPVDADFARFHDQVPIEIVEPLLLRLGYPPPPLIASFAGSTALAQGEQGAWWSTTSGGVTPYAAYLWEYQYRCPPPPPCTGKICTESPEPTGGGLEEGGASGPTCGVWEDIGTSSTVGHAFTATGTVDLRLIVWDGAGTVRQTTNTVIVSNAAAGGAGNLALPTGPADAYAASSSMPEVFAMYPATPNPFGGETTLRFAVPQSATISVVVYDALGREIARAVDGPIEAGWHEAGLDTSSWPAGTYLVRMEARGASGPFAAAQRITRLR